MQIKHTHTLKFTHTCSQSHTHTGGNETKPIETDVVTTKIYYSFYYYFIRKQTQHTHTHECKRTVTHTYGNAAPPTHSAYACDNSDSAATPSGRARREREPSERDEKFTLAALPAT